MNKFKKALVTLLAGITAASSAIGFSSCFGGGLDYGQDVDVVAYDGSKVTITFHHTMGQNLQGALDRCLPAFNKLFPNITVEHKKAAGDYDTLRNNISTELTAKNSPNIAFCYPDHVALYNKGLATVALDDYIESTETITHADGTTEQMGFTQAQIDDFYEIFYAEGSSYGDDKTYSLPFFKSTEVMYYNKTFFEEHNLQVPTTWDEMETVCAAIREIDPKAIPLGYDSEANWFITLAEQYGSGYTTAEEGNYFVFNNETNRAFVEELRGWYDNKYFTTKEIFKNYTSNLFNVTAADQTKCYMCIGSTGGSAYQVGTPDAQGNYAFEIGIAQIPQVDPAKPKVIQQGPSVCVFKKSNPQEVAASWLFIKYFTTSVQFQGSVSMVNGYTPVIKSVMSNENYLNWLNAADEVEGSAKNSYIQASTVKQSIAQMDSYFTSAVFDGSSAARDQVGYLMQNCFVGNLGNQTAAQFIQAQFEKAMATLEYEY